MKCKAKLNVLWHQEHCERIPLQVATFFLDIFYMFEPIQKPTMLTMFLVTQNFLSVLHTRITFYYDDLLSYYCIFFISFPFSCLSCLFIIHLRYNVFNLPTSYLFTFVSLPLFLPTFSPIFSSCLEFLLLFNNNFVSNVFFSSIFPSQNFLAKDALENSLLYFVFVFESITLRQKYRFWILFLVAGGSLAAGSICSLTDKLWYLKLWLQFWFSVCCRRNLFCPVAVRSFSLTLFLYKKI